MNRTMPFLFFPLALLVGVLLVFLEPTPAFAQQIRAVTPTPQREAWWMERHERALARIRQGHVDLLFIGDSITQGWEEDGRPLWDQYYAGRLAANLGYNSDQTDNVLWRLQNGELDGITPKLAIVMIGTNNTAMREDPPENTVAGIRAILNTVRTRLPGTKILLLAIFPRGLTNKDPLRRVNEAVNDHLPALADQHQVFSLNLNGRFLDGEGRLPPEIMSDALHPSALGYRLWAEGMEESVRKLLGE